MNTQEMYTLAGPQAGPRAESNATFDHCMLTLAAVLVLTLASAASILVTLPEALEAVATPAFGAPWITARAAPIALAAPARQQQASVRQACVSN